MDDDSFAPDGDPVPPFTPIVLRTRSDGWTAGRQIAFIQALAETACVAEAAGHVGMKPNSAYALRRRPDAASFRAAWDSALDYATSRLADAALGRALNGVATPIFYQGEQIGERRHYDERLTMFLLRYRDPARYGAWLDRAVAKRHPDGAALMLQRAVSHIAEDGLADSLGRARPKRRPLRPLVIDDDPEEVAAREDEDRQRQIAREDAANARYVKTLMRQTPPDRQRPARATQAGAPRKPSRGRIPKAT